MLYIQSEKITKELKNPITDETQRSVVLEERYYISLFDSTILRLKISHKTARKLIEKGIIKTNI